MPVDEEIDAKLNELKAPYTKEEFDKRLKDKNPYRRRSEEGAATQRDGAEGAEQRDQLQDHISDKDISDYLQRAQAEFNLIEPQYHLARILVTNQPNPKRSQPEEQQGARAKPKPRRRSNNCFQAWSAAKISPPRR